MYEVCKKFLFDARVDLTFVIEMIVVLKKIAWIFFLGGGGWCNHEIEGKLFDEI